MHTQAARTEPPAMGSNALMATVFLAMVAVFTAILATVPEKQEEAAATLPAIAALAGEQQGPHVGTSYIELPVDFFADGSAAMTEDGSHWLKRIAGAAGQLRPGERMRVAVVPASDAGELTAMRFAALAGALAALGVEISNIELASMPEKGAAFVSVVGGEA